jgi:hypothetical protein
MNGVHLTDDKAKHWLVHLAAISAHYPAQVLGMIRGYSFCSTRMVSLHIAPV